MKKVGLSTQILKKINSSSIPQFKSIRDIDKDSKFNMLQYAIFLVKYGDMHNLNEEEYIYLLENSYYKLNEAPSYKPMDTMTLIFGVRQNQKIMLTTNFLDKLYSFHTDTVFFPYQNIPYQRKTDLTLILARSLLDCPNIEPSSWMWLLKKHMIVNSNLNFSAKSVKKYLLDFYNNPDQAYLFKDPYDIKGVITSIDYLVAVSEQEFLNQSIKEAPIKPNELHQKLMVKI